MQSMLVYFCPFIIVIVLGGIYVCFYKYINCVVIVIRYVGYVVYCVCVFVFGVVRFIR